MHEREWIMLAAAAMAGGKSARQAAEAADSIITAAKDRFKDREDDDK